MHTAQCMQCVNENPISKFDRAMRAFCSVVKREQGSVHHTVLYIVPMMTTTIELSRRRLISVKL